MLRVITCIGQEHNFWLLLLAALLCAITSVCAFVMLERGLERGARLGAIWTIAAGIAAGLGVWATHFVAMTAYNVGLPLTFAPWPLFVSLGISLAAQAAAFWIAYGCTSVHMRGLAGAVSGLGIVAMHYLGMTGLHAPAIPHWDATLVGASVFMSLVFASGAFVLWGYKNLRLRALYAGAVLVVAICALHFTGMAALTLSPFGFAEQQPGLSQEMLGVVVGFATLLCLIGALGAALSDAYLSNRDRQENKLREMVAERTAELQALAERQIELAARAEAANSAKSQFLANMSHELRTPLNAIIGYGEMIVEDARADPQQAVQDANSIVSAAGHLLAIINGILDLSKIDAGRVELELEPFVVRDVVEETLGVVRPAANASGTTLLALLAPDIGDGFGDTLKLKQCLLNLLSNALKFSEGGEVTLRGRRDSRNDGAWLVFEVADTGIGISPDQVERLFQPFTQADASTTRRFGGTGLGLAITQRLARLMRGDISVRSTLGQGSRFQLRVPASLATTEARQEAA